MPPTPEEHDDSWSSFLKTFAQSEHNLASQWAARFNPLRAGSCDAMMVVAQIGQTLDGRIATITGHSKYINGPSGLTHLHRLRALVDAVVIGVGTALADDPLLTVRLVEGKHPARVVIDPKGRLNGNAQVWADNGSRRILIIADTTRKPDIPGVEVVALQTTAGRIAPSDILKALFALNLKRVLIEGGADTVSSFMQAGCLDRLHVLVAPIILGSGRASFVFPAIERMDQATRIPMHSHSLGDDMLFDCDLSGQRVNLF